MSWFLKRPQQGLLQGGEDLALGKHIEWTAGPAGGWVVFLLLVMMPALAVPEPFEFQVDNEKLRVGELQLFQRRYADVGGSKKRKIAAIVLINAKTAEVWDVLKDWDAMGRYVPDIEYYRTVLVVKPNGSGQIGKSFIEGKLDIPLFDIRYTLDVTFDEPKLKLAWRMLTPEEINIYNLLGIQLAGSSSGIESLEGWSAIHSFGDGSKTVLTYSSTVEYSMPLPEFLEDYIAGSALAAYMNGIKKEVESQGESFNFLQP